MAKNIDDLINQGLAQEPNSLTWELARNLQEWRCYAETLRKGIDRLSEIDEGKIKKCREAGL